MDDLSGVDPFDRIEPYVRQRLVEDQHLRAKVLFAEVQDVAGGCDRSYETFCRQIRNAVCCPIAKPVAG